MKRWAGVGLVVVLVLAVVPLVFASPDPPVDPPAPAGPETLALFLAWVVGGTGAGVVAYWLMEQVPGLAGLGSELKRYVALGLASLLACGAYVASVGLAYAEGPVGWQGWLEALVGVAWLAVVVSQSMHARLKVS